LIITLKYNINRPAKPRKHQPTARHHWVAGTANQPDAGDCMTPIMKLPVQENMNAKKYGFATKLLPVFVDGVQAAWEQVHINSRAVAVRRDSAAALNAHGFRASFKEYDPILEDRQQHADRSAFKPVWTGD
jgi:hypothetical protein